MTTQPIVAALAPLPGAKCCPNCGYVLPKPRAKSSIPQLSKDEKKSLQDAIKCTAAIAILQRRIGDSKESPACKVAFQFEIERLTLALEQREADPYKLKRIFRRKET